VKHANLKNYLFIFLMNIKIFVYWKITEEFRELGGASVHTNMSTLTEDREFIMTLNINLIKVMQAV
jgi:hypothetical protein